MPRLSNIVTEINTGLKTVFKGAKFQKGDFQGICELNKTTKEGETKPAIINDRGVATKVIISHNFPIQFYHRVLAVVYNEPDDSFGDERTKREEAEMKLVCVADRKFLGVTREDIFAGIGLSMITDISDTLKKSLDLKTVSILPGSFELDRVTVNSDEFNIGQEWFKPSTILLSYTYTIATEMDKGCFSIC